MKQLITTGISMTTSCLCGMFCFISKYLNLFAISICCLLILTILNRICSLLIILMTVVFFCQEFCKEWKLPRIFDVIFSTDMKWKLYIESISASNGRKVCSLYQLFSPESNLLIYKSSICSFKEYCYQIGSDVSVICLEILERFPKRIGNIIGRDRSSRLQSLPHNIASITFLKYTFMIIVLVEFSGLYLDFENLSAVQSRHLVLIKFQLYVLCK